MKCLLFIITLFLGRCIDAQGIYEPYSSLDSAGDIVSLEITKANPPEESEQSAYDDKKDYVTMTSKGDASISESESSEEERREKLTDDLKSTENSNEGKIYKQNEETLKRFEAEKNAGEKSDLIGQNQHIKQSHHYNDLGRRSVAEALKNIAAENDDYLIPEKAPPELVLLVAKESALLRAGKDTDQGSDFDRKEILRTGDYWNGVWREKVNPKSAMRSASQQKKLGSIKAKIIPGTEFYKVVSRMQKISPKLLYIINKEVG